MLEERIEVATPVAAMPAGRVERWYAAYIRPFPDRALSDAEVLRCLTERQPLGRLVPAVRAPSSWIFPESHREVNLAETSISWETDLLNTVVSRWSSPSRSDAAETVGTCG